MSTSPILINASLLEQLSQEAKSNERLRKNYNLHPTLTDPVQRLLHALVPGTQIPIHRHPATDEVYILLSGRLRVFFYNEHKAITDTFTLDPREGQYGLQIPAGQWHTLEVVEEGSVIFEVKQGPYSPLTPSDILE